MKQYRLINNLLGWIAFAIAAVTYCLTVEPTASFWDCPEFITTANKLEVGHPPGAPFFMLTGNFFTQFASDTSQIAYMINIMSALLSAFCILFLFWSITHLARKLICTNGEVTSWAQTLTIMACGMTGALAYTWSDTFWYSAVEGEVYAYSSMFTALVFWLILKWEDNADNPHSDRWLVLIFYLTGLSIGVHLLNLLCLPAIGLVYYFKKNPSATAKGSLMALCVSGLLVAAVLYGVVPGIVKVGGWFELLFVNVIGLPFNSGLIVYLLVLISVVLAGIWFTNDTNRKRMVIFFCLSVALLGIPFYGHGATSIVIGLIVLALLVALLFYKNSEGNYIVRPRFMNTALLCMLMLMIGYSSYAVIVIRSTQNTPMDQNSPEDIFTLGTYLNREQYGSHPLFYGEAFTSQPTDISNEERIQRHEKIDPNEPDKYDIVEVSGSYVYPSKMKMFFPRIYSSSHANAYREWEGDIKMKDVTFYAEDENGNLQGPITGQMPSQRNNLHFFMSYQVNFMYWRYFMWNFAGRQNDVQGHGEYEHGNWITGIDFLDNIRLGDQSLLPDTLKENKGHNVFYCLPLLLGLLGLCWQAFARGEQGIRQFWVVFFLFFMTGLAIVLYLNQTPLQPRERDYAYAGSFYAFAIWIGLGVAALVEVLRRLRLNEKSAAVLATVLALCVPLQMVSQTWDDHDRSGRYACRDFGANYLNTLTEQGYPVIFTNGDNDTFPLWYNQEIEGVRTDTRVCNLSYLQTDWYTDQMRRPAYDSPALPIQWKRYEYVDNMGHDFFYIYPQKAELDKLKAEDPENDPYELTYIIDNFIRNPRIGYFPTDSIVVKIDKEAVLASGMHLPYGPDSIPSHMHISLKGKRAVAKNDMMVYEMLARANWKRPLYMSVTLGENNYAGLREYCVLEGLAYRVTPFKVGGSYIDTETMYDNVMHKFQFGNINQPGIYLDETTMRMCNTHRGMLVSLASALYAEGKSEKALDILRKCEEMIPGTNVPYEYLGVGYNHHEGLFEMPDLLQKLGQEKEAERILLSLIKEAHQNLEWYNSLNDGVGKERILFMLEKLFNPNKPRTQLSSSLIGYGRNAERNWIFFSSALQGLENCNSEHAKFYRDYLDNLINTPVGNLIAQRMMHEMPQ
ncbi:MAG: DUF2723 domain-containing protein [Bacteroidaceae bacterium]|nr:DUF2723 domain-containing protein [Bacteroidaceae bacterium]